MVYCGNCRQEREGSVDSFAGLCCEVCGIVLEESTMVNEVAFSEDSHVIGQFLSETSSTRHLRGIPGTQTDSREQTLEKAKRNIQTIGAKLNITEDLIDAAHRFYKLALEQNFTKGRRANNVAAACLYCVCRIEKKPIMLLDFSEHLQEDVFVLGRCFTSLIATLHLEIPLVEPWFYIRRFASNLEFGAKYNAVVTTALKLVSRFRRDWMETGRRPAGLCAASLIIAARVHGFRRSQEDVSNVARICSATLSKRLVEFSQTAAAKLTPEEFDKYAENIDEEQDPPSFQQSQLKKKEKQDSESLPDLSSEMDIGKDEKVLKELEDEMESEEMKTLDKDVSYRETQQEKFLFEKEEQKVYWIAPEDDGKLADLDDNEMESYLIKDEDIINRKRDILESEYGEFLEMREQKEREKAEQEALQEKKPKKKRKKEDTKEPPAKSAAEATANMLKKKNVRKPPGIEVEKLFDTSNFESKEERKIEAVKKDIPAPKLSKIESSTDYDSILNKFKF